MSLGDSRVCSLFVVTKWRGQLLESDLESVQDNAVCGCARQCQHFLPIPETCLVTPEKSQVLQIATRPKSAIEEDKQRDTLACVVKFLAGVGCFSSLRSSSTWNGT